MALACGVNRAHQLQIVGVVRPFKFQVIGQFGRIVDRAFAQLIDQSGVKQMVEAEGAGTSSSMLSAEAQPKRKSGIPRTHKPL